MCTCQCSKLCTSQSACKAWIRIRDYCRYALYWNIEDGNNCGRPLRDSDFRRVSHNVVTMETSAIGWPFWLIPFWYLWMWKDHRKLALVGIFPNQILFSFSSDKDRRTDSRIRRRLELVRACDWNSQDPGFDSRRGCAVCVFVWSGCQFFYLCRSWKRREFDCEKIMSMPNIGACIIFQRSIGIKM